MTPFEKAGYTKDTKFRVLNCFGTLEKGDIVTLDEDDGTVAPKFKTEDGRRDWLYLPNTAEDVGVEEELEVYEEPKSDPKKYEYLIENYTHELLTTEELLDNLNKEGSNGWELCGTVGSKFIYKREV